ncbi:hypothetical protein ACLB1N_36160 [Escherichia coli]
MLEEEPRKQVHTLQMQEHCQPRPGNNRQPAKTLPSPLQGMKIMSVERGIAGSAGRAVPRQYGKAIGKHHHHPD